MFNKDFRPRRLRTSDTLRRMVRETRISADSLIWPIFIIEGEGICDEIPSLPGQYHYSPDMLGRAVERMRAHGVSRVLLFGLPKHKDENGSSAWDSNGVVQQGIRALRAIAPELYIITDVCMCEYTSHGHCGILCGHYVDNDRTLEVLARTAVSHARAGADMVAPSDMMDGRVAAIRAALDENGFVNTPVMAYSGFTGLPVTREASAVVRVIPADGPSLGTAPEGTWIWRSFFSNFSASFGYISFTRLTAICTDSFITSPSRPVITTFPLPFVNMVSINRISPPA